MKPKTPDEYITAKRSKSVGGRPKPDALEEKNTAEEPKRAPKRKTSACDPPFPK